MAIDDLLKSKFLRVSGAVVALAVPTYTGCEGDSNDGSGGSNNPPDAIYDVCNNLCSDEGIKCGLNFGFPKSSECYDVCFNRWKDCSHKDLIKLRQSCYPDEYGDQGELPACKD
ncbi:hypothetical protein HZC32_01095 [Candidatus Woesearchaeota archaeon]|nr:hypothetical protein [Candidatus Woesearchaeota archaeon]